MNIENKLTEMFTKLEYIERDVTYIKKKMSKTATKEYVDDKHEQAIENAENLFEKISQRVKPMEDIFGKTNWLIISSVVGAVLYVVLKFK
jgi:polyhydroxyalkanoate synthesis regulator phasin